VTTYSGDVSSTQQHSTLGTPLKKKEVFSAILWLLCVQNHQLSFSHSIYTSFQHIVRNSYKGRIDCSVYTMPHFL